MIRLGIIEDQVASGQVLLAYLAAQPEFSRALWAASHAEFVAALPSLTLSGSSFLGRSGIEGLPTSARATTRSTDAERAHRCRARIWGATAGHSGLPRKNHAPAPAQRAPAASGGQRLAHEPARGSARYPLFPAAATGPVARPHPRGQDIVRGIEDGLSYKPIARRLTLGIDTVRDHVRQTYRRLEVNAKIKVIAKARTRF